MSSIDTYGEFDLPEEKSVIEVVEDPVKVVLSCYDMFLKILAKHSKNEYEDSANNPECAKKIYEFASAVFNDKSQLKMDFKQINKLLRILGEEYNGHKNEHCKITGFFLSTLQNLTSIDALLISKISYQTDLGYKLKKDKILVIFPEITCRYLGFQSEGSAINLGECMNVGAGSNSGVYINANQTKIFGGNYGSKGIFINQGCTHQIVENTSSTISINKGKINYINNRNYPINIKKNKHLQDLDVLLDKKLAEINFLKSKNQSYSSKRFYSFNWKKFTEEVSEIAKRIQNKYYETCDEGFANSPKGSFRKTRTK